MSCGGPPVVNFGALSHFAVGTALTHGKKEFIFFLKAAVMKNKRTRIKNTCVALNGIGVLE